MQTAQNNCFATVCDIFSMLLGLRNDVEHKHRCECGHIWKHCRENVVDMDRAHTCPKCGESDVRYHYKGSEDGPVYNG